MQIPGLIQAAQPMQSSGSPATPATKGVAGQEMDFMSILQLLFTGSNLKAASMEYSNSGNGKRPGFIVNLPAGQLDELFPLTEDNEVNRYHAGEDSTFSEAALYELLAVLPGGIPREESGLTNNLLSDNYLSIYARIFIDEMVAQHFRPQEYADAKTADNYSLPKLPGRLILNQEQARQLLQFLSRDNVQQTLNQLQQNIMPAEKSIDQSAQLPSRDGLRQTPEFAQQNAMPEQKPVPMGDNTAKETTQPAQVLARDGMRQTLELAQQSIMPSEQPAAAGYMAKEVAQSARVLVRNAMRQTPELAQQNTMPEQKPVTAQSTVNQQAEQPIVFTREAINNQVAKMPDHALPSQSLSGKAESSPGTVASYVEQVHLAQNTVSNAATTVATGQGEVTGPSNVKTVIEIPNNTLRNDLTQIAANNIDPMATAAKTTGAEAPPAVRGSDQPFLFMQLAEAIRGQVARDGHGRTHVRLQLQPESLGEVVIKLVYKDGNVSTHFHAATESVRQAIESSLGQLREALTAHNLNLQQSTVTTGDDQGRWAQEPNREQRFDSPHRQSGDERNEKEETASEPFTEPPKTANRYRVNHFV